jgi:hypothetical protein
MSQLDGGVNTWPSRHRVRACGAGPSVDDHTHVSMTSAGWPQSRSGHMTDMPTVAGCGCVCVVSNIEVMTSPVRFGRLSACLSALRTVRRSPFLQR